MNIWEVIGALAGIGVFVVQAFTAFMLVQMKADMLELKVYVLEKFVTKENAAAALAQTNESYERVLKFVSERPRRHE